MTSGCRVDNRYRNLPGVPVGDVLAAFQFTHLEAFLNAGKIVFVPVGYENGLSVGAFDQILQRIQLPFMEEHCVSVRGVDRSVCELAQLAGQGSGVYGIDLHAVQLGDHLALHFLVYLVFGAVELNWDCVHNTLWHLEVICASHGDGDVSDAAVDLTFCARTGSVGEHLHAVAPIGFKELLPVVCDEPPEALAHIKNTELRPEIHQTVAGGSAGESNHAPNTGTCFHQAFEPF